MSEVTATGRHNPVEGSADADLLTRIGNGDEQAFEALYRRYRARLTRFLSNLLRRPHLVEEVLDDTMIAVWQNQASFRGASKPSTWIFAIAYRKAMKALRRLDEPLAVEPPDNRVSDEAPPDDRIWRQQRRQLLREAMEQLSPDHRAVVDMTYFHEMSCREVAEVMNCPVDTVKTRMFHARRHLRRAMAGNDADWI